MAVPTLVVWMHGMRVLAGRRSGELIILVGWLGASAMPVVHTTGAGIGTSSGFVFVWTLIALGVTGIFSVILAARP